MSSPNSTDQLIESITKGDVKMRPRWYFVLLEILAVVAIIIFLLIAIYLASFIIFVLHQTGAWFVPVFGLAGWYALFNALPWVLILLSAVFVVALAFLGKRYQFGYQWPLIYSFLGVIFLVAALCFVFVQTALYNNLFNSAVSHQVPLLGDYYPGIGFLAPNDIHRGTILLAARNGFILQDRGGNISSVIIASGTNLAPGANFQVGDSVVIFGDRSSTGTIIAGGVEKVVN